MYKIIQENLIILIFTCLVIIPTSSSENDAFEEIKKRLEFNKKGLSAKTQQNAALGVIQRLLPSSKEHEKFKVFVNPSMKPNSFEVRYIFLTAM